MIQIRKQIWAQPPKKNPSRCVSALFLLVCLHTSEAGAHYPFLKERLFAHAPGHWMVGLYLCKENALCVKYRLLRFIALSNYCKYASSPASWNTIMVVNDENCSTGYLRALEGIALRMMLYTGALFNPPQNQNCSLPFKPFVLAVWCSASYRNHPPQDRVKYGACSLKSLGLPSLKALLPPSLPCSEQIDPQQHSFPLLAREIGSVLHEWRQMK